MSHILATTAAYITYNFACNDASPRIFTVISNTFWLGKPGKRGSFEHIRIYIKTFQRRPSHNLSVLLQKEETPEWRTYPESKDLKDTTAADMQVCLTNEASSCLGCPTNL